jgi:hypothetical protein
VRLEHPAELALGLGRPLQVVQGPADIRVVLRGVRNQVPRLLKLRFGILPLTEVAERLAESAAQAGMAWSERDRGLEVAQGFHGLAPYEQRISQRKVRQKIVDVCLLDAFKERHNVAAGISKLISQEYQERHGLVL